MLTNDFEKKLQVVSTCLDAKAKVHHPATTSRWEIERNYQFAEYSNNSVARANLLIIINDVTFV